MGTDRVVLTGATGAFGRYLLRELLDVGTEVTVLARGETSDQACRRVAALVEEGHLGRLTVYRADLAEADLGLEPADCEAIRRSTTAVLHAAASTRFDLPLEAARRCNVDTLRNILGLAASAAGLTRFGYVSTAFVAVRACGVIPEAPATGGPGFVSTYDQTKHEAEALARSELPGLPVSIYRPSLVVAPDSGPGHAAVAVLDLVRRSLLPALPGDPDDPFDIVPAAEAARAIVELFADPSTAGATFHIASGAAAPTVGEIVGLAVEGLGVEGAPSVLYTGHDPAKYEDAVRTVCGSRPECRTIYQRVGCFTRYLAYPKLFATGRTEHALGWSMAGRGATRILGRASLSAPARSFSQAGASRKANPPVSLPAAAGRREGSGAIPQPSLPVTLPSLVPKR